MSKTSYRDQATREIESFGGADYIEVTWVIRDEIAEGRNWTRLFQWQKKRTALQGL